jgi:hypothetical protein
MSKAQAIKMPPEAEEEKPPLALVETSDDETPEPSSDITPEEGTDKALETTPVDLAVYIDSLGVSILDRFSLVRIFRDQWHSRINYYCSDAGGSLSLDQAIEAATHQIDEQQAAEIFERLLTKPAENIDFSDLHKLWINSENSGQGMVDMQKILVDTTICCLYIPRALIIGQEPHSS